MGNSKIQIKAPILLAFGIAAGLLLGAFFIETGTHNSARFNTSSKFREVMSNIENAYVDDVDSDKLVDGAITNMLEKLDPHSVYIPKRDVEITTADLKGKFDGIGIEFNIIKDTIIVVAPLVGGPSEAVGIKSGDKIVKVDGDTVAGIGITIRDVMGMLRGEKGSEVIVSIKRSNDSELLDFTIIRNVIPQYSVDVAYMINDEIGYIKVTRFSATTFDEFHGKLAELIDKGMTKLVLDLQGNPGGYMDKAVSMADEFISGDKLIVSQDGRVKRYNAEFRSYRKGLFENGPAIVLINEGSASGSEIVAGALQDHDRALIVGRRSFGKGLVQMPIALTDGSELRLTISRYYTPSGRCIQKPYEDSREEYHQDRMTRYQNGEYFSKDSIEVNDSLKYKTSKGRNVYGGGGIMPDYFVSLDTTYDSHYFSQIMYSSVMREYTLDYYNKNQEFLEKMTLSDYNNNFVVTERMLQDLISLGESSDVPFNKEEFEVSKPLIKNRIKAYIGRSAWKNEGWYLVSNQYNEALQEALKLFDKAQHLASAKYLTSEEF